MMKNKRCLLKSAIEAQKRSRQGKNMKFAREYRQLTKTCIAKQVKGVTTKKITRFENGFENSLTTNQVIEIMKILNFPMGFLNKEFGNYTVISKHWEK